ncbi:MAG: DUF4393 domain-containing protein [Amylibacter sp.]|nr:DUF4393 domain-containing protein [Amylibacter sp.]
MGNPIDTGKKIIDVAATVMNMSADTPELKEAGENVSQTALTISKAINNCLLPIAVVNFAFDKGRKYFEEQFQQDLENVTTDIPEENIIEPKASLAAPVLQGLAFSHEELPLKEMYLNLLKSTMDSRNNNIAHPAFAKVIEQLTAEEAKELKPIMEEKNSTPIIKIVRELENGSTSSLVNHIYDYRDSNTGMAVEFPALSAMVDNWVRLGLINVTYSEYLTRENAYDWADNRPEYLRFLKLVGSHHDKNGEFKFNFKKGILRQTAFGENFSKAVIN